MKKELFEEIFLSNIYSKDREKVVTVIEDLKEIDESKAKLLKIVNFKTYNKEN